MLEWYIKDFNITDLEGVSHTNEDLNEYILDTYIKNGGQINENHIQYLLFGGHLKLFKKYFNEMSCRIYTSSYIKN